MTTDAAYADPIACPNCGHAMAAVTHDAFTFDRCDGCGGLWFDLMEHRHVRDDDARAAEVDVRPADPVPEAEQLAAPARTCPRCRVRMTRLRDVDRHDVIYDYCAVCNGTFFDAGEFRRYAERRTLGRAILARLGL